MSDERAELTPAQQALNVAIALTEAAGELMGWAQHPDRLANELATLQAEPNGLGLHPFTDTLDPLAQAICDLHFLCAAQGGKLGDGHPTEPLAEAAARWLRGED